MKGRLRNLEAAVGRVEGVLEDEERMAATLLQVWRYEHSQTLSDDETLRRMHLARELDVGNPAAFDEWKALMVEEIEYMGVRADEWVSGLEPREQRRWRRLLAAPGGVSGDQAALLGLLSGSRTTMRGGARS